MLWLQKWNKTYLAVLLGYETIIWHHHSQNPGFCYVLMPAHCELMASLLRGLGLRDKPDMFIFLKPTPYIMHPLPKFLISWGSLSRARCAVDASWTKIWSMGVSYSEGVLVAGWTKFYSLRQCVSVVSKVSNLFISQEALCTVAHPYYQAFSQGPGSMQKIGKNPEVWNQCLSMTKLNLKPKL